MEWEVERKGGTAGHESIDARNDPTKQKPFPGNWIKLRHRVLKNHPKITVNSDEFHVVLMSTGNLHTKPIRITPKQKNKKTNTNCA